MVPAYACTLVLTCNLHHTTYGSCLNYGVVVVVGGGYESAKVVWIFESVMNTRARV